MALFMSQAKLACSGSVQQNCGQQGPWTVPHQDAKTRARDVLRSGAHLLQVRALQGSLQVHGLASLPQSPPDAGCQWPELAGDPARVEDCIRCMPYDAIACHSTPQTRTLRKCGGRRRAGAAAELPLRPDASAEPAGPS